MVLQVLQVSKGLLVPKGSKGLPELRVHQVILVLKVLWDQQVQLVRKELSERKVILV
jgi:hypothetical protein